jgi:RNA polymerase sigma-70 factor (ECF subfamily)
MHSTAAKLAERLSVPLWKRATATQPLPSGELHRRYLPAVLRYAAARLGAGPEAEDAAAEVFAAAFGVLHRCPREAATEQSDPVRAWLIGIARRKVADVLRRRSRRPEAALDASLAAPATQGPEASALSAEARHTLRAILDALPELQREALRLKYVDELSLVEIGQVLGKSPAAVGQLLHRARQAARLRGSAYFTVPEDKGDAR